MGDITESLGIVQCMIGYILLSLSHGLRNIDTPPPTKTELYSKEF